MTASCGNNVCGKKGDEETALKSCAVCKSISYCSVSCQKSHWQLHKKLCTETAVRALLRAIQTHDTDTIRRLSKTKRVVNGKVDYTPNDWEDAYEMRRWTPLHECIRRRNRTAMQLLIDGGGAKLNVKDADGESLVFVAATNLDPGCLSTLLSAGADPNSTAGDGFSALMAAARGGCYENTKLLLEAGASVRFGTGDLLGRGALELAEMQANASGTGGVRMRVGETLESAKERFRRVYQILLQYSQ